MDSPKLKLETLHIRNFATFKSETISFKEGFNSIIGETGSGKSLILDALQFILGQRADKKVIRKGSEYASLEAVFISTSRYIKKFFLDSGFPFDENEIVIKRVIQLSGSSKVYLNHHHCQLKDLQNFSQKFIDFVGQFSNQKLLKPQYQMDLLDSYGGLLKERESYRLTYEELLKRKKEFQSFQERKDERLRKIDYLEFQIKEIESLSPSSEEEKELINNKNLLLNFEKKHLLNQEILSLIEQDQGLLDLIQSIYFKIQSHEELFTKNSYSFIPEMLENFNNLSSELSNELEDEYDVQKLEEIVEKLDDYQKIKRKFGPEIENVLEHYQELKQELKELQSIEKEQSFSSEKIKELETQALRKAQNLRQKRQSSSQILSEELIKTLKNLKMPNVKINLEVIPLEEIGPLGGDELSFLIETNAGEGFFKLQDIASGGELSRVLLALRNIHAQRNQSISIFLFDEIDTGIGGSTALAMGKVIKEISQKSQVIAITHLPQIAQYSNYLIEVSKKTQAQRTKSFINNYEKEQIPSFVKKMSSLCHLN